LKLKLKLLKRKK